MYKVLIADAEEETLKKFKAHMKTNFKNDFKVVKSTTENNIDFLELLSKTETNLIIIDVRFFGISSYKIINDIHVQFEDIKFILYGDINDIEYLKYSSSVGALGYMLKPVKAAEFSIHLNNAKIYFDKVAKEKEELANIESMYKKNIAVFETYFLNNLLKGIIKEESEIINNLKYFKMNIKAPYTVVNIRVNEFKKKILTMDEEEKHLFIYQILNTVKMDMKNHNSICLMNSFNAITVIIGNIKKFESIMNLCQTIKESIKSNHNTEVSMGIGHTYEDISKIYVSFNEAEGALKHKFYMGYSTIIPIQYVEPNNKVTYKYPFYKEKKLVHSAVAGEFDYCKTLLKSIFDSLKTEEPVEEKLLQEITIGILISIGRNLSEQNVLKDTNFSEFFCISTAMGLKTVEEGYHYLYTSLEKFCKYIIEERQKRNMVMFAKVKEYIENRYYETISLINMAKEIGTTPEYLNNLFLDYEKRSYYDYVVNVRLLVAKRFLRETEVKDSIIAANIGYADERYFRSIFMQYERISTEEYRIQNRGIGSNN